MMIEVLYFEGCLNLDVESDETECIFAHVATLERPALLRAVLKRNPNIRSAQQVWRAALAWRMRR